MFLPNSIFLPNPLKTYGGSGVCVRINVMLWLQMGDSLTS